VRIDRNPRALALSFAAASLIGGYASAHAADIAGIPLVAVAVLAVLVGAFAWVRRGCEFGAFFGQAMIVAYCGYLGFVIERIPYLQSAEHITRAARGYVAALDQQLPLVAVLGVPFALAVTAIAGLTIWLIPQRGKAAPPENAAFWNFVEARNEKQTPQR
jgi:hypothetical protein